MDEFEYCDLLYFQQQFEFDMMELYEDYDTVSDEEETLLS